MKKRTFHYGAMIIAAFITLGLALSTSSYAKGIGGDKPATELTFIGNIENQPLFQLSLNNAEEDEYTISISDIYGNLLYSDRAKGVNISRKLRLNTDEIGDEVLKVKVKSRKNNKLEIFEIKRNSRLVEETYVSKL